MPAIKVKIGSPTIFYKEYGTKDWKKTDPTTGPIVIKRTYPIINGEGIKLISIDFKTLEEIELIKELYENLNKVYSLLVIHTPDCNGIQRIELAEKCILSNETSAPYSKNEVTTHTITFHIVPLDNGEEGLIDITEVYEQLNEEGLI
jgi:hypothetical protein